jgi:DNA-directed RNA polymerase subunit M/transcription elongation factor TFIIS
MANSTIHLKIKTNPNNELFSSQIRPYVEKVSQGLSKTHLKPELISSLELAIRNKTKIDIENLHYDHDFNTFKNMYMTNSRHIIENLKTTNSINNVELIEKVNNGLISMDELVQLNPEDMHTERWRTLIEKKLLDITNLTKEPESTTTLYHCNRCNRNKCTYFLRQDRSADEPMTVHITCCYCGKKWKQ